MIHKYEQHIGDLCDEHRITLLTWQEAERHLPISQLEILAGGRKENDVYGCCLIAEKCFYVDADLTHWKSYLTALHEIGHIVLGLEYEDAESAWHVERLAWDWAIKEFRGILWPCKMAFINDSLKTYEETT